MKASGSPTDTGIRPQGLNLRIEKRKTHITLRSEDTTHNRSTPSIQCGWMLFIFSSKTVWIRLTFELFLI